MKRFLTPLILLVFAISILVSGVIWWQGATGASSMDSSKSRFLITKGMTAGEIAVELENAGLVKSELVFRIYVQVTGVSKSIPSGEYDIPKNLRLSEVVNVLLAGPSEVWVTIAEGLRREEIAEKVVSALNISTAESATFRAKFLEHSADLEGFLFPDTYLFPKDVDAQKVIQKLVDVFNQKAGETTIKQVILASLIERETKGNQEKPIVAGIILKRLTAGWPLQIDAAVQYAVAADRCLPSPVDCSNWWPVVTKTDLEVDSPYNTYKYQGLPPTPISNPGLASIKAAKAPEESMYWYYIHDDTGQIHYAATLEEHNSNIRKYLGKS